MGVVATGVYLAVRRVRADGARLLRFLGSARHRNAAARAAASAPASKVGRQLRIAATCRRSAQDAETEAADVKPSSGAWRPRAA